LDCQVKSLANKKYFILLILNFYFGNNGRKIKDINKWIIHNKWIWHKQSSKNSFMLCNMGVEGEVCHFKKNNDTE